MGISLCGDFVSQSGRISVWVSYHHKHAKVRMQFVIEAPPPPDPFPFTGGP